MWFDEAVIYQIYPLGLCGAPAENDGVVTPRILRLLDWVDHIKKTGADTVLLNPVFDSDRHGYDTRNFSLWTLAWATTATWPRCARPFTTPASG